MLLFDRYTINNPMEKYTAEYYQNWTEERITRLQIQAPYEPKDSLWVRGSIRHRAPNDAVQDLVVTGPKMKVCFSGCNWNRIVFAMNGAANPEVYRFEQWLYGLANHVKNTIWADPGKYKSGATNSGRFMFDDDFVKPAKDPAMYPDELRCRLSTKRIMGGDEAIDVSDADLFTQDEAGNLHPIDPTSITSGSHIIPVLKFSYYRNMERFGIVITVLRGLVFPAQENSYKVANDQWHMDYPQMEV